MLDLDGLDEDGFRALPLVIEGESKEVRYAGDGHVVIRFKPTLHSRSASRRATVAGSDRLRLRVCRVLSAVLKDAGIPHAYHRVTDRWVLADLVLQPPTARDPEPFRPVDLTSDEVAALAVAPPVEVLLQRVHAGPARDRYFGITGFPVRENHPLYAGMIFAVDEAYPLPVVRFDWRNPCHDEHGKRLANETLPDAMADWFLDVVAARRTALHALEALTEFLGERDVLCCELCLQLTQDGETVFGEVSQDGGRYLHIDGGSLDRDLWRAGGASGALMERWQLMAELVER